MTRRLLLIAAFYCVWILLSEVLAQPPTESSMGSLDNLPPIVRMTSDFCVEVSR